MNCPYGHRTSHDDHLEFEECDNQSCIIEYGVSSVGSQFSLMFQNSTTYGITLTKLKAYLFATEFTGDWDNEISRIFSRIIASNSENVGVNAGP